MEQINPKSWRAKVMDQMQKTDLSIAQVARRAGYEPGSVYLVLGGRAEPSLKMMIRIDEVLNKELGQND